MEIDMRNKGCPNVSCEMHMKKKKWGTGIKYCPKCGTETIYVCSKCFREIEDLGSGHRICKYCEAKRKAKLAKVGDTAKEAVGKVAGVGLAAVGVVAAAVGKEGEKEIGKVAAEAAKAVVDKVVKK